MHATGHLLCHSLQLTTVNAQSIFVIAKNRSTLGHRVNEMTSLAHKTVLKIWSKVKLLHCCALHTGHDTDQYVSTQWLQVRLQLLLYWSNMLTKKINLKVVRNLASIYGQTNRWFTLCILYKWGLLRLTLITLIDLKWLKSNCVSHKLCCIKSAPTLPNVLYKQSALRVFTLAPDGLDGPCMHAWMLFSFTHFPVPSLHQEYTCLHTHTWMLHTIYSLITHSFNHFVATDNNIGLVAEYDYTEDSVGIALKMHDFIPFFHYSV